MPLEKGLLALVVIRQAFEWHRACIYSSRCACRLGYPTPCNEPIDHIRKPVELEAYDSSLPCVPGYLVTWEEEVEANRC
jgi:hypothetical protein